MNPPAEKKAANDFSPAVEAEILIRLTQGLAHDCNNAMAAVLMVGEDFQFHLDDGLPFPGGLQSLRGNVMRTKALVQRIVELPHQSGPKTHQNLNDLVAEAADLTRKFSPSSRLVEMLPAPEPLPVYVDTAALRWLLIELAWLAAMASESGKICFATAPETQSARPGFCLKLTTAGKAGSAEKFSKPAFRKVVSFVENHGAVFTTGKDGVFCQLWLPESDFTETGAD